jgi:hypothetical protein
MLLRTVLFSALLAAAAACSDKQGQFSSSSVAALELTRNSDGVTADVDAGTVADAVGAEATTQASTGDSTVSADLESSDVKPATNTEAEASSTSGSDSASHTASQTTASSDDVTSPAEEEEATGDTSELIGACLDELKLTTPSAASFTEHTITGKNKNKRVLFSDKGPDKTPLFLRIHLKNVNRSSLELLTPERIYCVDMRVKNMNKFRFKFHCDAKVAFVNLQHKKAKKVKTLRVQCAE